MADTHTDPFLSLARDAYRESTDYFDAGVRREIEGALRQFQGLHPHGSKYLSPNYQSRSRFFRPKTRASIRKNEAIAAAAFFNNPDVVTIAPEDTDNPTQVASAAVWQEVLNYRLRKTVPWFQTVLGAYQDAMVTGVCISYQHWRYDHIKRIDTPCVTLLPVENVRFASSADWINPVRTSPYFIRMIPMYLKDAVARTKTSDPKTGDAKWLPVPGESMLKAVGSYTDSLTLQREHGRPPSREQSAVNDFSKVWVHQNFIEVNGVDWVYYTLSDIELLSKPVRVEQAFHPFRGERPFVVGNCVIETHKLYPESPTMMSSDIQGELNENANQRIDNVRFAMNKRFFAKRGRQVDIRSLVRNVPSSVTLMEDPETDVKIVETKDVTRSSYEEQDRLNLDFDELVGNFSQASVGSNRKLAETMGGMEMLTMDASQLAAYQLKVFAETWAVPVLRQVVLLEQSYETDDTLFTLAGKKAQSTLRLNDPIVIDDELIQQEMVCNVNVGVGATNPQVRLNQFLGAMRSYKEILEDGVIQQNGGDVQEIAREIFARLGFDGPDRFFKWVEQEDPRVAALQAELDEANAKLAKREDPALTKAKIEKLLAEKGKIDASKVKELIEAMFGAMQGAEVIADVPRVAPIADQVMRAAGYIPPTPPGQDPGFAPGIQGPGANPLTGPVEGLNVSGEVSVPNTGVSYTPPGAVPADTAEGGPPGSAAQPANTNPLTPAKPAGPKSPFVGPNDGIETMRSDSEGPKP